MIDLSGLEAKTAVAGVSTEALGKPLELLLIDIEEDPNQPRRTFDKESMGTMIESICLNGVRTPVSVRTHPEKPGKWMLNYGARRYRASMAAGKTTIPAFVDQQHTDYHQVIENLQRDDLKPMELALFIQKKLTEGTSKAEIARTLSIPAITVTEHLALIDPPECIEEIYSKGKCTSPKTLYELRNLHGKFPKEVTRWCDKTDEVTRGGVAELSTKLKGPKKTEIETKPVQKDEAGITSAQSHDPSIARASAVSEPVRESTFQDSSEQGRGGQGDSILSNIPTLYVSVGGRRGVVLLHVQPQDSFALMVQFEEGTAEEIPARSCLIEQLVFAEAVCTEGALSSSIH